ncbi:MAG: hypothetical protein RLZZ450_3570 [Pseudomonadota bacterium]|jgi:hypothetical protein
MFVNLVVFRRASHDNEMKNIVELSPGDHEVEFVREQKRQPPAGGGTVSRLTACIVRVVGTSEELEDASRATAGSAPGTRFTATVEDGVRYASFKPHKKAEDAAE